MKQETQTLLIHIVGVAVVALAAWIALQLKGTDDATNGLRVALIGGACGLYGKLGFKPAPAVLDAIVEKMVHKEPQRIARLTSMPPPPTVYERMQRENPVGPAPAPPDVFRENFTEVRASDGSIVGYAKKQEPKS